MVFAKAAAIRRCGERNFFHFLLQLGAFAPVVKSTEVIMEVLNDLERPRQEIEAAVSAGDTAALLRLTGLIHGHYCPGSAMGVKAAARAVREMKASSTGMEEVLAIVETNSCFADGVQVVTGCTLGNNALIYRDFGKMAVTLTYRTGDAIRVAARPDGLSLDKRHPEAYVLFDKVVRQHRGTEEDSARLRHLWIETSFKVLEVPDDELFTITRLKIEVPAYARIFGSVTCAVCGESTMEPRARVKDGKVVCLACSGQAYYQLAGDGMSLIGGH
jgi:formylmethanofuran dehydrogenase subunit E